MSFLDTQEHALNRGIVVKDFDLKPIPNLGLNFNVSSVFQNAECNRIIEHFEKDSQFYPVGVQGKSDVSKNEQIGSHRITVHDVSFSRYLTHCLFNHPNSNIIPLRLTETSPVDWKSDNPEELNYWIPLHVSPVFRYMKYKKGGNHFVHYDSSFKTHDNPLIRTMQSGVLYLSDNKVYTRLINDKQAELSFDKRTHLDWTQKALKEDVVLNVESIKGNILTFPHYLPHDVTENFEDKDRIVIRFDIFYQAVGKI